MAAVLACAALAQFVVPRLQRLATITGVALPELKRHGYSGRLATGTLAASGTLGILIPPSVPLVIYAILTEQNIAKLFAVAMVPGIIAMFGYMTAIAIYVRLVPGHAPEVDDDFSRLTWQSFKGVAPIMAIFIIVFGGIYSGMFTPTEGAAVGPASTLWPLCSRAKSTGISSSSVFTLRLIVLP
jgi:TRAP-type C4-dicarboxylate transport system permease large subunit